MSKSDRPTRQHVLPARLRSLEVELQFHDSGSFSPEVPRKRCKVATANDSRVDTSGWLAEAAGYAPAAAAGSSSSVVGASLAVEAPFVPASPACPMATWSVPPMSPPVVSPTCMSPTGSEACFHDLLHGLGATGDITAGPSCDSCHPFGHDDLAAMLGPTQPVVDTHARSSGAMSSTPGTACASPTRGAFGSMNPDELGPSASATRLACPSPIPQQDDGCALLANAPEAAPALATGAPAPSAVPAAPAAAILTDAAKGFGLTYPVQLAGGLVDTARPLGSYVPAAALEPLPVAVSALTPAESLALSTHHRGVPNEPWAPAFAQPLPQRVLAPAAAQWLPGRVQQQVEKLPMQQAPEPQCNQAQGYPPLLQSGLQTYRTWPTQSLPQPLQPLVPHHQQQPTAVPAGSCDAFGGHVGALCGKHGLTSGSLQIQPICDKTVIGGGSGRNLAERLSWSAEDDAKIVESVLEHGCKWRLIASFFEGRSDDAVRNRWNRVKDLPVHNHGRAAPQKAAKLAKALKAEETKGATCHSQGASAPLEESHEGRVSWSRQEDEVILRSVGEMGHKWHSIAQQLPGRTEHAIRNRFARLQSLANRGKPIVLSSGLGQPIGIQLVPQPAANAAPEPLGGLDPFSSIG